MDARYLVAVIGVVAVVLLVIPVSLKLWLQGLFLFGPPSLDHALLFLVLGCIALHRSRQHLAVLVTFACASELLQNFTSHREVLIEDAIANLSGIAVALVVGELIRYQKSPARLEGSSVEDPSAED